MQLMPGAAWAMPSSGGWTPDWNPWQPACWRRPAFVSSATSSPGTSGGLPPEPRRFLRCWWGFCFLLEQRFAPSAVWQLALRTLAAGGGCVLFRQALEGAQLPRWVLLASLCSGLSAVSLGGFSLGMVGAAVLCAAALPTPSALPVAALGGLALELQGAGAATAIFILAAIRISIGGPGTALLALALRPVAGDDSSGHFAHRHRPAAAGCRPGGPAAGTAVPGGAVLCGRPGGLRRQRISGWSWPQGCSGS